MFENSVVIVSAALTLFAAAAVYLSFAHRAKRRRAGAPSAAAPEADRWIVLEIERKGKAGDGILWEVRDSREVVR